MYLWQLHRFSWARFLEDLKKATYFSQLVRFGSTELKGIYGRPLYKDPIAIFSSEWFFELFNAQIVVCIRHPAAFVSSLMNLGWTFNFDELLKQEVLVKEFLEPHLKDILSLQQMEKSLGKPDILKQGILLWNIIYSYVEELRQKYKDHPDWIFIKHEDLSLEPLEKFAEVFQQLEIPYTQKIQKAVSDYTTPNKFNYRAKNSRENITIWKDRLQKEEIELIREKTSPIWNSFYEEKDW